MSCLKLGSYLKLLTCKSWLCVQGCFKVFCTIIWMLLANSCSKGSDGSASSIFLTASMSCLSTVTICTSSFGSTIYVGWCGVMTILGTYCYLSTYSLIHLWSTWMFSFGDGSWAVESSWVDCWTCWFWDPNSSTSMSELMRLDAFLSWGEF